MDTSPERLTVLVVMLTAIVVGVGGGFAVAGLHGGDDPGSAGPTPTGATGPGEVPTASARPPSSYDVELVVGYCWVEAVEAGGRRWDLAADDQFSAVAANTPEGISGTGTATSDGPGDDTLDYVDADGGRLTFIPAGDPRTLQDRMCE